MQRLQLRLSGRNDREIHGTVGAVLTCPLPDRVFVQVRRVQADYLNDGVPEHGVAHPDYLDGIITGELDFQRFSHSRTRQRKTGISGHPSVRKNPLPQRPQAPRGVHGMPPFRPTGDATPQTPDPEQLALR